MSNEVNFDALASKANETRAREDIDNLFRCAFALPQWHFIARGQFPDVHPYIASNAEVADGQYMVRAFTDTDRLLRFAQENNLVESVLSDVEKSALALSMPTDNIVDYLEQFMLQGVYGVWFNSDTKSDGFFIPLKQLRPIKEHLENKTFQNE